MTASATLLPRSRGQSAPHPLRRPGLAMALAGAVLLGGCASMSPEECRSADWYEQGLRDGVDGEPRTRIDDHVEACGKVGVRPDRGRYMRGYGEGLERFCTPASGADYGARGRYYTHGTCPVELEGAFERQYRLGRAVYDAHQTLDRVTSQQRDKQRELERAKDDDARQRARRDLQRLDREADDARDALRRAERNLDSGRR